MFTSDAVFTSDAAWQLHPRVALRPEPFGALAYHYDTRRLNFLRSHDLVAVVSCLERHDTADDAFEACEIAPERRENFSNALKALAASDFLIPQPDLDEATSASPPPMNEEPHGYASTH